jgi:hypothetical protein
VALRKDSLEVMSWAQFLAFLDPVARTVVPHHDLLQAYADRHGPNAGAEYPRQDRRNFDDDDDNPRARVLGGQGPRPPGGRPWALHTIRMLTPIEAAIAHGNLDAVAALTDYYDTHRHQQQNLANPETTRVGTPWAPVRVNLDLAFDGRGYPNVSPSRERIPLAQLAVGLGQTQVALYLLRRMSAARCRYVDTRRETMLHTAAVMGDAAAADYLLRHWPAMLAARDEHNLTPLHYALLRDNYRMARLLLRAGADLEAQIGPSLTILNFACLDRDYFLAARVLEFGANVHTRLADGRSALHAAVPHTRLPDRAGRRDDAELRYWEFARLVNELVHGRDVPVDALDAAGATPLMRAMRLSSAKDCRMLVRVGADPARVVPGDGDGDGDGDGGVVHDVLALLGTRCTAADEAAWAAPLLVEDACWEEARLAASLVDAVVRIHGVWVAVARVRAAVAAMPALAGQPAGVLEGWVRWHLEWHLRRLLLDVAISAA